MNERIEKWNERYARREGLHEMVASPPLPLAMEIAPPGHALDLAAGAGRHALALAERGWHVVAVDGAERGVDLLRAEVEVRGLAALVDARVADLKSRPRGFEIEPARYDMICDFYFLDRTLFDEIRDGVRPGGLFVGAIHMDDPGAEDSRDHGFLLAPGELESIVRAWRWDIVHSREGASGEGGHHRGTSEIVARKV